MSKIKLVLVIAVSTIICNASAQNYVSTYSGNGTPGFINGNVDTAKYSSPFGMCIDKSNNLYVADGGNNCIRKINISNGTVTTLAGTGAAGWKDGVADSAKFNSPSDLCVDDSGNIYVSDFLNQRIRKISFNGIVSTIAGNGTAGYLNGNSSATEFNYPRGICRDKNGNLFIGDSWNHRIRKIDTAGNVTTFAGAATAIGVGSVGALADGTDTSARFYTPSGLTIDQYGNIFVADAYNHRIRKIDSTGIVTTVAGNGTTGPGNGGYVNGDSTVSRLNTPTELFVDTNTEELYISDTFNDRIRKLNLQNNNLSLYAGSGTAAFTNGVDTLSAFNYPRGIVVLDSLSFKNIYVVDYNNHAIRLIGIQSTSGVIESNLNDNVEIYPNPFSDRIFLFSSVNRFHEIIVYDNFGKLISDQKINFVSSFNLDLSGKANGIYIIKICGESGKYYFRRVAKD